MAPWVLPPARRFGNSQRIPRVSASGGTPLTSGSGVGGIWKDSLAAGFSGSLENGTQQEGAESRRCADSVGRSARNRFDRARRQAPCPSAGDCYPPSSLGGRAHGGNRDLPGAPPCRAQAWRAPEPPVQSGQVRRPASSFLVLALCRSLSLAPACTTGRTEEDFSFEARVLLGDPQPAQRDKEKHTT